MVSLQISKSQTQQWTNDEPRDLWIGIQRWMGQAGRPDTHEPSMLGLAERRTTRLPLQVLHLLPPAVLETQVRQVLGQDVSSRLLP